MLIPSKKMMSPSTDIEEVNDTSKEVEEEEEEEEVTKSGNGSIGEEKNDLAKSGEESEESNGEGTKKATDPAAVARGYVQPSVPPPSSSSSLANAFSNSRISDTTSKTNPAELKQIPYGEPGIRTKLRFDVVTARVIESSGKKHVSYSVMMKRVNTSETHSAVIERRYNDFCYVYECILRNFHPSILGDFLFPKKVLIGNFKAEVITERTEAFHKFLNLIANCDNLLYSDYFYSFLSSEEHNEAVSHIKLCRYEEAVPLLEQIFYVREKLLTISNIHVLQCMCELVATLNAIGKKALAFSYVKVAQKSFELVKGHPDAEVMRVSFLKLASQLAKELGHDSKPFDKYLSELRYQGTKLENAKPLLELIRERYIHRASHTAKIA